MPLLVAIFIHSGSVYMGMHIFGTYCSFLTQATSRDAMVGNGLDRHLFALYVVCKGLGKVIRHLTHAFTSLCWTISWLSLTPFSPAYILHEKLCLVLDGLFPWSQTKTRKLRKSIPVKRHVYAWDQRTRCIIFPPAILSFNYLLSFVS